MIPSTKEADMTRLHMARRFAIIAVVALAPFAAGCAKKAVEAPPTPAPAPPQETTTPTPSTETPKETPPTPGSTTGISASDFQPVFFDFDSYTLRADGRSALDANARLLRDNSNAKIVIEGHCDERGTVEYNQALGERRAQAARDYLAQAGITDSRLRTVSYGKERPFDPGHDEAAWAKNRRAHFVLQ
jgi:peptidoglycan-associated lipoprotein